MANSVIEYVANGEQVKLSPAMVKQYLVSGTAEVTDQEVVISASQPVSKRSLPCEVSRETRSNHHV